MALPVELEVRELTRGQLAEAAAVLARGMRDNPTSQRVFGRNPVRRARRLARFYARSVPQLHRRATILGAYRDKTLVAVLAVADPGRCQPSILEPIRLLPAFLYGQGPIIALRLRRWMKAWARHDLAEPHWHLGPAAVDADSQGQGIGRAVLPHICDWLDRRAATAYLETDQLRNVRLYQHFGFDTIGEAAVLDVPSWFMVRGPQVRQDG